MPAFHWDSIMPEWGETQWKQEAILWPVFYPAPAFPGTLKYLKMRIAVTPLGSQKVKSLIDASLHSLVQKVIGRTSRDCKISRTLSPSPHLFLKQERRFGGFVLEFSNPSEWGDQTAFGMCCCWPWLSLKKKIWEWGIFWWIMSKTKFASRKGKPALVEGNQRRVSRFQGLQMKQVSVKAK